MTVGKQILFHLILFSQPDSAMLVWVEDSFPSHMISLKLAGLSLQQTFFILKIMSEPWIIFIYHKTSGSVDSLLLSWNICIKYVFGSQIVDHLHTAAYLLLAPYTKKYQFCSIAYDSDMQRHFNCSAFPSNHFMMGLLPPLPYQGMALLQTPVINYPLEREKTVPL